MNLYLISQTEVTGLDTYDSAVVAAMSEDDARTIHPCDCASSIKDGGWIMTTINGEEYKYDNDNWVDYCDIDLIEVEFIGETIKERGVILASGTGF